MRRYSSRRKGLDKDFINQKLKGAVSYDRIAGFFRSSILEVAGEALEKLDGTIRVVCNSDLSIQNVETAKAAQQAIRLSWCAGEPEKLPEHSHPRFARLFEFLVQGKMQVRVLPDEVFGLIHGKAGVITYADGSKTSFLGSANESKTAWKLNYELVWEDESLDSIIWVQEEFDALWNHSQAVPLADFVVQDINRIANRIEINHLTWRSQPKPDPASVIVETPIYRQELGLWAHQKFFIKKAFEDHLKGGARYILADQVGLGKTVQLAVSGLLMALHGDKPVLVIAPKPLVLQWQGELKDLVGIPSAIWNGRQWIEELENDADTSENRDLTADEIKLLRQCWQLLEDNQEKDPKYQEVKQYLIDKGWLEKGCIIFSQYYDSVMWLATQLSSENLTTEKIGIYSGESRSGVMYQGILKRMAREEIKQMVRRGELRLIIGTDAASEGLNLQKLGTLINLDTGWDKISRR